MTSDALDELIVDENSVPDSNILGQILKDFVLFTKKGEMIFSEKYRSLPDWKKILIYLLARKAAILKNLISEKESAMPAKIGDDTMVSNAAIGKRLARELKGVIKKDKEGYFIPNFNIFKCRSLMNKKGRKNEP